MTPDLEAFITHSRAQLGNRLEDGIALWHDLFYNDTAAIKLITNYSHSTVELTHWRNVLATPECALRVIKHNLRL